MVSYSIIFICITSVDFSYRNFFYCDLLKPLSLVMFEWKKLDLKLVVFPKSNCDGIGHLAIFFAYAKMETCSMSKCADSPSELQYNRVRPRTRNRRKYQPRKSYAIYTERHALLLFIKSISTHIYGFFF